MKRSFLVSAALLLVGFLSFATSNPENKSTVYASQVMIPLGNTGKTISLLDLSRMSVKDLQAFTGVKMRFADRIAFKLGQRQLKRNINPDGTINSNKLAKYFSKGEAVTSGFNGGGFALGLLLSLIGVLIAYLIKTGDRQGRIKWAWIGAAISAVIWILIAVI